MPLALQLPQAPLALELPLQNPLQRIQVQERVVPRSPGSFCELAPAAWRATRLQVAALSLHAPSWALVIYALFFIFDVRVAAQAGGFGAETKTSQQGRFGVSAASIACK